MTVAAIVPAYNEERTIHNVLAVLAKSRVVNDVIVVSDGSEDNTAAVARRYAVKVVDLPENLGKGGAMRVGAINTQAEILLFIDADLIGLTETHLTQMVDPVAADAADMTIGVFDDGRLATDWAQKLAPFLSGQRAMKREIIEAVPEIERTRYGVEVALSRYGERCGLRVQRVQLKNLAQVMKEEKIGLWRGVRARVRMYWEILRTSR